MSLSPKTIASALLGVSVLGFGCGSGPEAYLDRGNRFFDSGKLEDAAIQYQKAIQKSPKLGEAHYRLALTELKRNDQVSAYGELQTAVQIMPGNHDVVAKLGELSLSLYSNSTTHPQPLYDQATQMAAQLLSADPKDFDGNLLKGALALAERKPSEAVVYLRTAATVKPDHLEAKLGLAQALIEDNQTPAALRLAEEAMQKDTAFGPAYDFLYTQYRAAGRVQDAENILKLKARNNPKQAAYILELARHYASVQKPAEATAAIRQLVDNSGDFPNGRLLAGDFYASAGQAEEGLREYEKGMDSNPKDKNLYRKRMARLLATQQRWPEAEEQLGLVIKEQPEDREAKLMQALVWLDEGKPEHLDGAIAELRSRLGNGPADAALHFQIGNALARKGDQNAARREWLTAAKRNANYLPPRISLVQTSLSQGKAQDALSTAEEMITIAPLDEQARILYATCLTENGKYVQARAELNRLNSESPQVRYRLGVLSVAEHKYKEAETIFRQLEGSSPRDLQVIAGLAQAYAGQNETAKAMQLLQDELKRDPNSPVLRQLLARFSIASGKAEIAIEQYKQLAAAQPNSLPIQLSLATAYIAKGDLSTSIEVLKKAAVNNPRSAPAILELAEAEAAAGQIDESKNNYRRVLQLNPGDPNALNDLAYLMSESGENLDQALGLALRAERSVADPNLKVSITDTLGWIYLKKNRNEDALQLFQTLVKSNPRNATFRYHLGAALYQSGEKQKARAELQAALSSQPGSPDEAKIRELLGRN